ncbi:MAG: DUF3300 domain-containing protein, partial [Deltaproteobacteria bacterium]|nr:DUF3300 domain-containing protein [Deltaproteobacteria bacterium]
PWWYPAYPPYYWYYPPGVIITGGFISFGPRFFIGIDLFAWSWFDWHRHYIYIDVHRARRFHRFPNRHYSDRYFWKHDPVHRRGVAYRDRRTSERFGKRPYRRLAPISEMRVYPPRDNKTRAVALSRDPIKRRGPANVPRIRTKRERIQRTQGHRERASVPSARPESKRLQIPEGRNTSFHGVGNGNFERRASERGVQSRQGGYTRHQGGSIQRQIGGSRRSGQGSGRQGGGFRR